VKLIKILEVENRLMARMAIASLLATVFVGAVEAQTVAQTLYTDTTPVDKFLAAHPGSSISSIDQNGVTVQTAKGKTRILSPGLTYQNGSTWAITKAQVNLLSASAGWSLTGTPVPILISGSGSSMHVTVGGGTKTLDWRLSSIAYTSAKGFTFQSGGLAWTLNLHNTGVDFQSQVTAKKGAQTFTFPYTFTAGTVSVDSKGNLNFGSVFSTSHSAIIGADHNIYPCSAWSLANSVASFSCDDTALPAAAYPYVIDPTTVTYTPANYSCYDPANPSADNGTYCTLRFTPYQPYINSASTYTATFSVALPSGVTVTDVEVDFEGLMSANNDYQVVPVLTTPSGSITMSGNYMGYNPPVFQEVQWDIPTVGTQGYTPNMLSWFDLQNGSVTFTMTPQNYLTDDGSGAVEIYDNPSLAISYTEPPSGTAMIGTTLSYVPNAAVVGEWTSMVVNVNVQPVSNPSGNSLSAGFAGTIIVNTSPTYANGCNISLWGSYSWIPGQANSNGSYGLLNDSGAASGNVSNECAIQGPSAVPGVSGPGVTGSYTFTTGIPIDFTIAGQYTIWGNFTDTGSGLTSGWLNLGTVNIAPHIITAGNSTVSASLASVPADNTTMSTITVTLKDASGNPVSGKTVTLAQGAGHSTISAASGASTASGVVTFTVTDATVETVTYTATDATDSINITQSATVSFVAGVPTAGNSTVSASLASVPADNTTTSTITVTLKDGYGHPVSGKTVTLGQGTGHSTVSAASGASNASGVVTFTVKDATAETVTYTATDATDSVNIAQSPTVSFTTGVPTAGNSTVSASVTSVPADNTTTSTITVTLIDGNGHPVSGKTVTLAQGAGHSTISAASGASNASGVVTFTVKDATVETVTYTATDVTDSVSITQSATVSFVAGIPTAGNSTVTASVASVPADNTTTSTITVTLKDGYGHPVSGKTVTLAQGAGHSTISSASGASNASGVVTFTVKDATAETVTYTATDATDSVSITQSATVSFTAGVPTAGTSTASAGPASVPADNATTSTITVTLKDANSNPVSGKTVTLAQGAGHSTISAASGASNGSGVVTFTVKDANIETVIYTATDTTDSVNIAQTATVSFTAGVPTAGSSTVSASLASVPADNTTTSTITVTLTDGYGHPVSGKTVTLAQGTGHSSISAASGASNASGVVTFTVKDATAETVTYTATDTTDSVSITQSATVSFTAGVPTAGNSTVSASLASVPADNTTTSTITVTLKDGNGNPVSGKTVTLAQGTGHSTVSAASGASNGSGVVTFTVKDATIETVTYTATDTTDSVSISQSATVSFTAGIPTAGNSTVGVSLASVPADNTTTSTITVTLKDKNGNSVSGKTVTLAQGAGHSTISAASGASNASGVVTFTVKDATAETVTYTATDTTDSVSITQSATVTFTAGVPTALTSTQSASLASVPADNTTTSTITVTLKDGNGNPVSGKTVALAQGAGHSSISAASGASNATGVVSFTVKDATVETVTYTATDTTDLVSITQSATVTFTAGVPTALTSTESASLASVPADNTTTSTITVTLKDGNGNPVSGKTVTLAQGAGHSTISAASGASNASGVVTFTVKDATVETVTYTATDTTDSVSITQSATVSFTAGVPTAGNSTVIASVATVPADNTTTSTITITLTDGNGHPVSGKTVTLSQGAGHSTISAASGLSNGSGVVTFTVKDATVETVTYTAMDASDSVSITQSATISFTGNQAPTLSVVSSHTGSFTQGQIGATYSLTATNAGPGPTNGTVVTISDTLPAGLIPTAIAGSSWNCAQPAGPCTRSDVLGAGASYPALTLTVNVLPNAQASVTNQVAVSGGGSGGGTAGDATVVASIPRYANPLAFAAPASVVGGAPVTFAVTYTSDNGPSDIVSGQVQIDNCYLAWDSSGNVRLYGGENGYPDATGVLGQKSPIWAGNCSINLQNSTLTTVTSNPKALVLTLNVTFPEQDFLSTSDTNASSDFVGPHEVYAWGTTAEGIVTGTVDLGSLVVTQGQDFALTLAPAQPVTVGTNTTLYLTLTAVGLNGFSGSIALSTQLQQVAGNCLALAGAPGAISANTQAFIPIQNNNCAPGATAILHLVGSALGISRPPANSPDMIVATSNGDFTVAVGAPAPATLTPQASVTYPVTVSSVNGLTGSVSLSLGGAVPAGVSYYFSPAQVSLYGSGSSGTSYLTFTGSASMPGGSSPLGITGVAGQTTHTANLSLSTQVTTFQVTSATGSGLVHNNGQEVQVTQSVPANNAPAYTTCGSADPNVTCRVISSAPGTVTLGVTAGTGAVHGTRVLTLNGGQTTVHAAIEDNPAAAGDITPSSMPAGTSLTAAFSGLAGFACGDEYGCGWPAAVIIDPDGGLQGSADTWDGQNTIPLYLYANLTSAGNYNVYVSVCDAYWDPDGLNPSGCVAGPAAFQVTGAASSPPTLTLSPSDVSVGPGESITITASVPQTTSTGVYTWQIAEDDGNGGEFTFASQPSSCQGTSSCASTIRANSTGLGTVQVTYQNGPISVTQTARIRAITAQITEIWSDQFPQANIADYANYLPGGAGLVGNARQLMIMGARPDYNAYLKAKVATLPNNQEALNHVLVRFQLGDPGTYGLNGNPNPPFGGCDAGPACVSSSIFSLSMSYTPPYFVGPGDLDDFDYSVVVGVDRHGGGQASGTLSAQEISPSGTFNLPCAVAPTSQYPPCEGGAVRVVSPAAYSLYQTTVPAAADVYAAFVGLPKADTFLDAFLLGQYPISAAVGSPDTQPNGSVGQAIIGPTLLYFNNGVAFNGPETAAVNFYNFSANTALANAVISDPDFQTLLTDTLKANNTTVNVSTLVSYFNNNPSATTYTFPLWQVYGRCPRAGNNCLADDYPSAFVLTPSVQVDIPPLFPCLPTPPPDQPAGTECELTFTTSQDLYLTFGRVGYNLQLQATVSPSGPSQFNVTSVLVVGYIYDYYQWNPVMGPPDQGLSDVQAGYGPQGTGLGTGGQVFETRVNLNGTLSTNCNATPNTICFATSLFGTTFQ
jgi:hypothetical protein